MKIRELLLAEFDREMATTRTLLERVPEAKANWKPHQKSTALGALAVHVAGLAGWAAGVMQLEEIDFASPDAERHRMPPFESTATLLERFDERVRKGHEAIASAKDEDFSTTWTMKNGAQIVFALPRAAALRSFILNHHIHHRGQLSVYLRLLDVPLPSIYGPTADM